MTGAYTLEWARARRGPWTVVVWAPSLRRAEVVAYRLEWTGWFRVLDPSGERYEPFRA